ncbi:class I SAM-dependent DNA methyltransferase [Enterococcus casseliflavus]|uniref:class I SAM-dependent DNA methyltransferase n=1 Tax=Enterococcus casseliflavus TaxID=37734 RepID=UPI003D128588
MSLIEIEDKIIEIVNKDNKKDFIYDFLKIYDVPNSTITRLKNGTNNLSKIPGEVHLKNKLYFKETASDVFEAFIEIESKVNDAAAIPRYLFVTDFKVILAKDTKTGESLDIKFKELPMHFSFFLAWNGIEKVDFEKENPLDIKAAERFARLFDVLNKEIESNNEEQRHALNLFLMRLLFCLFAEDTNIFRKGQFTNGIKQYTNDDGNDLNDYIAGLFKVLDTQPREETPTIYKDFPYVNGQLFTEPHQPIKFNKKARKLILECGELLEWSKINPDIFGSMIQAVATEDNRSHLGMHYTSVPNIMKVINPLFLDEVKQQFEEIKNSWNDSFTEIHLGKKKISDIRKKHLDKIVVLTNRIRNMKFFDPACGSGNFLIITYKELRQLEIDIYVLMNEISDAQMLMYEPIVTLSQFYGIEIDEFASDIAKLSLWIAEHQMNLALKVAVAEAVRPTLPLKSAGDIHCGNALRIDWMKVCPQSIDSEIYIFGNPPYLGAFGNKQKPEHKADMDYVFKEYQNYRSLDYISAWFLLGSKYISGSKNKVAFVSTSSITQGAQVSTLWEKIFAYNIELSFCHLPFKWTNSAKKNAGVYVVVIGLINKEIKSTKKIFQDVFVETVTNINPYLLAGPNIFVSRTTKSLSGLPKMRMGNMANDGGGLIFSKEEYENIANKYPEMQGYFKKFIGAKEYISNTFRFCLWIDSENDYQNLKKYPEFHDRFDLVYKHRISSSDSGTNRLAARPFQFRDRNTAKNHSIIIPKVNTDNRKYIPIGVAFDDTILSDLVFSVYDGPFWLAGILSSRMHNIWLQTVSGKMGNGYRYSVDLCYNTFPVPRMPKSSRRNIEEAFLEILDVREELGMKLLEMYNYHNMPEKLLEKHKKLDNLVDNLYLKSTYPGDKERLQILFDMYFKLTEEK